MSSKSKPVPITIVISISVALSVAATLGAAHAGLLDFVINPNQQPLINGTILNYDNKTYHILIVPSNGTFTIPKPIPVEPPIINNTPDNNTIPNPPPPVPPVNNTPPTPPKPTCTADQVYNATTNKCDPKPVVTPPPEPVPVKDIHFIVVGDVDDNTGGTGVFNAIKAKNPDIVAVLGDLGYGDNLAWFKSTYGKLNMVCVPGNHESANEDGTTSIEKETQQFCSLPWYFKFNHVLFIGANTNGDLSTQSTQIQGLLSNAENMKDVKQVHLLTHKPCATFPNAHHPVEKNVKAFCDTIRSKVPTGVKFVNDAGHNHVFSANKDQTQITSGAGGRSHYTCGVSTEFPFCDNVHFGYADYLIKTDGTSTLTFYDFNGKIVK